MGNKILKVFGYWALSLTMFMLTLLLIRCAIDFVTWSTLDSGWAQAIGSVVAIMASFFLFRRQRKHEQQQGRDDELVRRTRAVAAVQDVAHWSLEAMEGCILQKQGLRGIGTDAELIPRLDELRNMLNRFVDPTADRIIVIAALFIGNALLETRNDLPAPCLDLDIEGIDRMTARRDQLRLTHERLLRMQRALEQKCTAHGIELEPAEVWID
jgi:hypothetical protein